MRRSSIEDSIWSGAWLPLVSSASSSSSRWPSPARMSPFQLKFTSAALESEAGRVRKLGKIGRPPWIRLASGGPQTSSFPQKKNFVAPLDHLTKYLYPPSPLPSAYSGPGPRQTPTDILSDMKERYKQNVRTHFAKICNSKNQTGDLVDFSHPGYVYE